MNRAALHKITYGLYIVTSGHEDKFNGQIANSLFQVTSNPATIAVSINKENYTHELIKKSQKFTVSVLSQDAPMTFIGLFGFKSGRAVDKLKDLKTRTGVTGIPIVLDYTLSYIEAEVEGEMSCGTHSIFFARVVEAEIAGEGEPLTYAYYQSVKGGKSSKNAPTYTQEEPKAKAAPKTSARYVCSVCGYIYDEDLGDPDGGIAPGTAFEDIPDSWSCPICGAQKDKFEKEK